MVIGSITPQETEYWAFVPDDTPADERMDETTDSVVSKTPKQRYKVEKRTISVAPALPQLFLEIATNITDHAAREGTDVRNAKFTMNAETGEIEAFNDGASIPVRMHNQPEFRDKYLTTVIFSNFRCGSNFDDTQARTGAGRNGYGAKCTNAWSTRFTVEHCDGKMHFAQTWHDNMSREDPPVVTVDKRKAQFTRITFVPDYARLGVTDIPAAIDYLRTFVWHLCPATDSKLNVFLDGVRLPVRNLKDYARIISPSDSAVVYDEGENIQVAVCPARPDFGSATNTIGFVNAIPCNTGTHVNFAVNRVRELIKKALPKGRDCSAAILKGHMMLFVNIKVINPTFTSQTKEQLSLDIRKSGAKWEPSAAFERNLRKSEILESVRLEQELRDTHKAKLASSRGARARHVVVEDYESANNAGKANRAQATTLILTEGGSAKGFAVAGAPNRDWYGIFPLRGKLKNVRGDRLSDVLKVVEIANVLKILGADLASGEKITSTSQLRYDHIMLCTDQDVDGAHITGLVINALYVLLPDLMRSVPNFVQRLATPLVRAWPKRRPDGADDMHEFMSEHEFETWFQALGADAKSRYEIKYFKGLGTSTARDAKHCFANLDKYLVSIDCTQDEELLVDFFHKDRVEMRRTLLADHGNYAIDYRRDSITLREYLMGEVLPFFRYDNERSIAHCVDGFKPAQRKIMWVIRRNYGDLSTPSLKVAQLSGDVAKRTQYKHGEDSLNGTSTRMAQDFPISGNNINLLVPEGMFGNRHGDDPASPRYIFTCGEAIARAIFPEEDFPVLEMLEAEGHVIEPRFMVPVIPMVLCNGTSGVGTGWSSDVPSFDPKELMAWCRRYNAQQRDGAPGQPPPPLDLTPWLEGFTGTVTRKPDGQFTLNGRLEQTSDTTLRVLDLPIYTNTFKFTETKKRDLKFCETYPHRTQPNSTDTTVDITFEFAAPVDDAAIAELRRRATLNVSCNNMHLWNTQGDAPARFPAIQDIAVRHAQVRLETYAKRKAHQIEQLDQLIVRLTDEYRFVLKVMDQPDFLFRRGKADVSADLAADGFRTVNGSYEYLLRLPFMSATQDLLDKLKRDTEKTRADLATLHATTVHDMWDTELAALEHAYEDFIHTRLERRESPANGSSTVASKSAPKKRRATKVAAPAAAKRRKVAE